jgi:tetratricopeptide (TPR) repeat protein
VRKKHQKIVIGVITAIICVALLGSTMINIFHPQSEVPAGDEAQEILTQEYNQRKQIVDIFKEKLEKEPENLEVQKHLADAYFSKALISERFSGEEFQEDLKNAKRLYQELLTVEENNEVLLSLANTAFLLGDSELAGSSYRKVLSKEPDNIEALFRYGISLFYLEQDKEQALEFLQKAHDLSEDKDFKKRLQEMITLINNTELNNTEPSPEP